MTLHPYPHTYSAVAAADPVGLVAVTAAHLPPMQSAPPPQFDGPGGLWSPETLLCAALADCFILTFRAVSRAASLNWLHLDCRVEGVLERVERVASFTGFTNIVTLIVPPGTNLDAARKLLEQAEHACLIANSLRGARTLDAQVSTRET